MKPVAVEVPQITTSLRGHRALVVPVLPCTPCSQSMPADHSCPAAAVRRSLRDAAATVHPSPGALETIRARARQTVATSERDSAMTDPIPPARHTVPALREMAGNVRVKAEAVEAEAAELHRAADEIDAIAAQLQAAHQPAGTRVPAERTCTTCGQATFDDGLGPQHVDPHLPCVPPSQQPATGLASPSAPAGSSAGAHEQDDGKTGGGERR